MLTAFVALIVGVITAILGSVTLIATKENKISEFRQAWVDSQRADLAIAVAEAIAYFEYGDADKKADCLSRFLAAKLRVSLREKPNGTEWGTTLDALDVLERNVRSGTQDRTAIDTAALAIATNPRPALKRHWNTVKSGEKGYQSFKYAFNACLAVLTLVFLAISVWGLWDWAHQPVAARAVSPTPASIKQPVLKPGPALAVPAATLTDHSTTNQSQ